MRKKMFSPDEQIHKRASKSILKNSVISNEQNQNI